MPGFFTRRYLTQFDINKLPRISTEALVIGSGAAGLRAAIELSGTCDVLLVTKGSFTDCATEKAQGGVAIAVPSAGGVEGHIADTIASGDGLCNEDAVRFIDGAGPEVIEELIGWGAEFDKEGSKLEGLTPRQMEVLELIAQGYNNAAIAERLSLSEKSVETYINVIYQQLHVSHEADLHSRVKATLIYLQESRGDQ